MSRSAFLFLAACLFLLVSCSGDDTPKQAAQVQPQSPSKKEASPAPAKTTQSTLSTTSNGSSTCSKLLVLKCMECHNATRVCQVIGKKNEERWGRTIKRMVQRGAKLTKSERSQILDCLVNKPGELGGYCN